MTIAIATFRFYWKDGTISEGIGDTVEEAFTNLGYGAGAIEALDYYEKMYGPYKKENKNDNT